MRELTSDELKEILPTTTGEEDGELVDNPEVRVWLTVEDATNTVTFEEMTLTRQAILSSEEILAYFDVNLFKQVGEMEPEKIHETAAPVKVTISPDLMMDEVAEVVAGGEYAVIRLHDGAAEKIEVTAEDGNVSFETNKFSIYALARPVVSQEADEPMPEVDPLGEIAEVEPAEADDGSGDELDVPDTGVMTKNVAVVVATYVPAVGLALLAMMIARKRHLALVRRRAQEKFYGRR